MDKETALNNWLCGMAGLELDKCRELLELVEAVLANYDEGEDSPSIGDARAILAVVIARIAKIEERDNNA